MFFSLSLRLVWICCSFFVPFSPFDKHTHFRALHFAAPNGLCHTTETLVASGASVWETDDRDYTPLLSCAPNYRVALCMVHMLPEVIEAEGEDKRRSIRSLGEFWTCYGRKHGHEYKPLLLCAPNYQMAHFRVHILPEVIEAKEEDKTWSVKIGVNFISQIQGFSSRSSQSVELDSECFSPKNWAYIHLPLTLL